MQISPALQQPKKLCVLVYSASDNDLKSFMHSDVDEMELAGSDDQMDVVVQFDHGGSKGAERLHIQRDGERGKLNSPVIQSLGSTDMADPKKLSEFIEWGMKNYPAENYFLVISDHGDGWKGAAQDYSGGSWMSLKEIHEGISDAQAKTGKKLGLIGFDACLMANTEVAYQLRNDADYLVGSQEVEGGAGWPYNRLLSEENLMALQQTLAAAVPVEPRELGARLVATAQGKQDDLPTMSAIDLSKMDGVKDAVNTFAEAILDSDTSRGTLRGMARKTEVFTGYKDLYHFAQQVGENPSITDDQLKAAARGVTEAISGAVYAEQHSRSYPNAHGLTVQLPSWQFSPSDEYKGLDFAKDTKWDEALTSMGKYWFWPWPI